MVHRSNKVSMPAIPSIQLYDSSTQVFTTAGEFHTWDTVSFKTSDFHYVADDDRVMLHRPSTGYYEITFECNFIKSGDGLGIGICQIYKNGTAVPGAKAIGCSYSSRQEVSSCACVTLHFNMYLNGRDYIQIKTTSSIDSLISSAETSRLIIKFIPTKGWDNSFAGNENYKGEVAR